MVPASLGAICAPPISPMAARVLQFVATNKPEGDSDEDSAPKHQPPDAFTNLGGTCCVFLGVVALDLIAWPSSSL